MLFQRKKKCILYPALQKQHQTQSTKLPTDSQGFNRLHSELLQHPGTPGKPYGQGGLGGSEPKEHRTTTGLTKI